MIGKEIQNYLIIEKIGEGGMATVYKAADKTLPNLFRAIKILNPAFSFDPVIRAKFLIEARTLASLDHPIIVKIYDYIELNGQLILIMEFVPGETLGKLIQFMTGPINEDRAKTLFLQIIDAIGFAHQKGIIHRDIKPSNIIVANVGTVKIIDFGIVKILEDEQSLGATKTCIKIGTPVYMSPEQIKAQSVDERTDIYAMGVTLFQMVTGKSPYEHPLSEFDIQTKIVNEPLPKANSIYPSESNHIQCVIDRATAKKKEERFQNCFEFQNAILHSELLPREIFTSKPTMFNQPSFDGKSMFETPFSIGGRIRRAEYGVSFIIFLGLYFIVRSLLQSNSDATFLVVAYIPMLWFICAQCSKRCHDLGKSGWWQIIPFYVFWLIFQEGQSKIKEFGDTPK